MKTFLILLLAVAVASAATTHSKRSGSYKASLNDYVDVLVPFVQNFINENDLNSVPLPNVTESFSVKPILITYKGDVSLYDGVLSNLNTLKRYDDVSLTYEDKVLSVAASAGVELITFEYSYFAKLVGMSAGGGLSGSATDAQVSIVLSADLKEYLLKLDYFKVNIAKINANLEGNAILDWLTNVIIDIVINNLQDTTIAVAEEKVTSTVTQVFDIVNEVFASVRD